MSPDRKRSADVAKLQKLLSRARSLVITQPVKARDVCSEPLRMPKSALKTKASRGTSFKEAFEEVQRDPRRPKARRVRKKKKR